MTSVSLSLAPQAVTMTLGPQTLQVPIAGAAAALIAQQAALTAGASAGDAAAQNALAVAAAVAAETAASTINSLSDIIRWGDQLQPRKVGVKGTVGRAYLLASGAYAFTINATQERPHYSFGVKDGFYLEGPSTVYSAPYHLTVPISSDPHFITNSGTSPGAIQYAGQHTAPDRFGTTGKAVRLAMSGTGVQRRQNNLAVALVANDILRYNFKFHIESVSGAGSLYAAYPRVISGSGPTGRLRVDFDAAGNVTGAATESSGALRFGLEKMEVLDGKQTWFAWLEVNLSASATMAYAYQEPAGGVTGYLVVHEASLERNPQAAPSILPVCAAAKVFAADVLTVGGAGEYFDVEFRRRGRVDSRQAGNAVQVPAVQINGARYAISGPVDPYETELVISRSKDATGAAGIYPTRNTATLDLNQLGTTNQRDLTIRGRGRFATGLTLATSTGTDAVIDIRGFGKRDWMQQPWMALTTSGTYVDSLRYDGALFKNASEFPTQFGQVGVANNRVNDIQVGRTFTSEFLLNTSHPFSHSRLRKYRPWGDGLDLTSQMYVGTTAIRILDAGDLGQSQNIQLGFAYRIGRAWAFSANNQNDKVAHNISALVALGFSSDGLLWSGATYTGGISNLILGDGCYFGAQFYQCAPDTPIMVNYGGGWQTLPAYAAANGLTNAQAAAALPCNRRYARYGTMNAAYTGTRSLPADVNVLPVADSYILIPQFEFDPNVLTNVCANLPGFQFYADARQVPYDSVWLSTGDKPASVDNPWIMVARGNGKYAVSGGAWTPANDFTYQDAVKNAALTHSDHAQKSVSQTKLENYTIDTFVVRGRGQGAFFLQGGNTTATGVDGLILRNGLAFITGTNNMLFDRNPGTAQITNVLYGNTLSDDRGNDGSIPSANISTNSTNVTLTNVISLKQLFSDGNEKGTAGADGTGSITGTVRTIRGPYINGRTFTPPNYTAPTPTYAGGSIEKPTLDMVVGDAGMNDRGLLNLSYPINRFVFSDFGRAWLGFDPTAAIRNVFQLSGVDFAGYMSFVDNVLHQVPIGHGRMTNTAAVGTAVPLYDDPGAVVLLPGHRIDPFFSGYGIDPPFRITEDGRVVLAWSLAGYDKFFTFVTRDAAGEYGPVITIDVTP